MKNYSHLVLVLLFFILASSALLIPGNDLAISKINPLEDGTETNALSSTFLLLLNRTVSDIIKDVDKNDYATEAEIVTDEFGRQIIITKMMIVFKPNATPSQFYELIDRLHAIVVSSVAGTRSVVVRIPQPVTFTAYYDLIKQIENESFVDFVWKGEIPKLDMLPSNFNSNPIDPNELPHIDNHLAIRAHAAWNASNAIDVNSRPLIVVADSFSEGDPQNDSVNCDQPIAEINNDPSTWDGGHGYTVLGVIAGTHGQNFTTGIYPNIIRLGVIDHPSDGSVNRLMFGEIMNKLLTRLTATSGKIVVNTSIGYECDGTGGNCIDIAEARETASIWIEYVRLFDLEDRVLHTTSAGNIEPIPGSPGLTIRDSNTKSPFASAARLSGLSDGFGSPLANLTNTIVVENAVNRSIFEPADVQPIISKCLYKESFIGGNLSGIGTHVMSYGGAAATESEVTGTSYSAPQVAGLAAYLWSIDKRLTPQQVKSLLTATSDTIPVISDPECSDWGAPAPIIDAYEALLAMDAADTPSINNSPVRLSVLDVNEDGSFDNNDLQIIVNKYYDTSGATPVLIDPFTPDYGRLDLNGDGWTGGSSIVAFDLDRIGSIQYGMPSISNNVSQDIEGTAVSFDENTVRDSDILCYYAYSNLYTGDNTERHNLLEGICQSTDITCTYTSYDGSYTKTCYDPSNKTRAIYTHDFPPANKVLDRIRLEIRDASSGGYGDHFKEVVWGSMLNQEPALDCDIGKPTGRFVLYSSNVEIGQNEYFEIDPYNVFFPKKYINVTSSYCWPDFNGGTLECGTYACPPIGSIQPALAFPGDCHQWWDHYDEQGNWVECDYP